MSAPLEASPVAARAAAPRPTAPEPTPHVWVRSLPAWHALSVGTIVATTLVALDSGTLRSDTVPLAVGLAAALLVGYWAMFIRPRPWHWPWDVGLPYVLAVVADYAILLQLSPVFGYLEFSLIPQIFFLLHPRRLLVAVGAIGLAGALVLSDLAQASWRLAQAIPDIVGDLLTIAFAFAISLWIGAIADQSAERQGLIDELERTRRDLAAAEREAGVLEERGRLAREIHDTLAQGFASVIAHLEAARASLPAGSARAEGHLAEAEAVARDSLADARGLAWALRPAALTDAGLAAAVERTVAAAFPPDTVATRVTVTGEVRALHPTIEVTLLRMVQEALANVRRHASADSVDVTLSYFEDGVSVDIADDGVGFDPESATASPLGGLGLIGMRERAEAVGGSLVVESAPGQGTTVAVHLPVPPASQVPAVAGPVR